MGFLGWFCLECGWFSNLGLCVLWFHGNGEMEKNNADGNEIRGFERNVNEGVNERRRGRGGVKLL